MANVKISELTALTPPDAADLVPVTDSSASQTKRTTVGEIVGIVNGDVNVATDGTSSIASGVIVDADVNASAAIAGTKIDPDFGSQTVETTGDLAINTDTFFVDASANAVGVGTTAPVDTVTIQKDTASAAFGGLTLNTADSNGSVLTMGISSSLDSASIASLRTGTGTVRPLTFIVGTNSANERMRIDDTSGRLLVGTSSNSGGALLQVDGDRVRISTAKTPASASDSGTTGEICWDANYIYVCTATNTWKRASLSTW